MVWSLRRALLTGSLSLTLLAVSCTRATPAPTPPSTPGAAPPPTVQVAEATRGDISQTLSYSGNVQTKQQVNIIPKVAGRVTKLHVDVGNTVKAGDVLLELDHDTLETQVAQAEAGLAAAEARLRGIKAGPRPEQVVQAEANLDMARRQRLSLLERGGRAEQIAQAEANLVTAQARMDQVKLGATPQELEQAKLAIDQSKNALWAAQTSRDGTCGNARNPQFQCDAANAQVAAAETAVQQAQLRLEQMQAGATSEQIAQAGAAVRTAEEQLKLARQPNSPEDLAQGRDAVRVAEAQLALAKQPVTEHDVEVAEAAVAQAKAAADLAKQQLAEATIRAPFGGVVSQRTVAEGAMAGPTGPVLTLISNTMEVVIHVEERNLGNLQTGQTATLTVTAYPGQEFPATVARVAPSVDARNRTFLVRLTPKDEAGKLRDGMFAQVRLPIGGNEDALLVPRNAIVQEANQSVVYVVDDGKVERRIVTIGAGNDENLEVVDGLGAGERVAVSGLGNLKDSQVVTVR